MITERNGDLKFLKSAKLKTIELDLEVNSKGQGGLLDIKLSPNYEKDKYIYLTYSKRIGENLSTTSLVRFRLKDEKVVDMEEIFEIVNEHAPEHLEGLTKEPFNDLYRIRNAGAIFLGPNTPEPVGDYFAGPNHTLPTSGCAKFSSPLGVQDFVKTSSVISYSAERLKNQGEQIIRFAEEEELFAHAAAIQTRLDNF